MVVDIDSRIMCFTKVSSDICLNNNYDNTSGFTGCCRQATLTTPFKMTRKLILKIILPGFSSKLFIVQCGDQAACAGAEMARVIVVC